jgi:hypothetical protein
MTLFRQIEHAFAHWPKPHRLIQMRDPVTPEQEDAIRFTDRDWREITWDDWERSPDALYAFTPEAFVYYLPSVLSVAAGNPERWLAAADALLRVLDRSPETYHWDAFISKRLVGLETEEYEVIKIWLLSLSGRGNYVTEDALMRSYETVELLQAETERVRRLMSKEGI